MAGSQSEFVPSVPELVEIQVDFKSCCYTDDTESHLNSFGDWKSLKKCKPSVQVKNIQSPLRKSNTEEPIKSGKIQKTLFKKAGRQLFVAFPLLELSSIFLKPSKN